MKKYKYSWLFCLLLFFPLYIFSTENKDFENANYLLGFQEGSDLKSKMYIIDIPSFKQGLLDGYAGEVPESIEKKKDEVIEKYIDWVLSKQTSMFAPKKLDKETIQSFSYFIASDYGRDFKTKFFPFNPNTFVEGLSDSVNNNKVKYDLNDQSILKAFYQKADDLKKQASNNKTMKIVQDQGFNNKIDKGISYSIISVGSKPVSPTLDSDVIIEYTLSELSQDVITNIQLKQTIHINIKDLSEGIKLSLLSMQEGEHSIFNIPTLLLFVKDKDNLPLNKALFDVTLISIDSHPTKPGKLKDLNTTINHKPSQMGKKGLLSTEPTTKKTDKKQARSKIKNNKKP